MKRRKLFSDMTLTIYLYDKDLHTCCIKVFTRQLGNTIQKQRQTKISEVTPQKNEIISTSNNGKRKIHNNIFHLQVKI